MNCTPNFEEIRPLEPDIEQFPCCGINEQRNATRQVDFQLRDNNTTGMGATGGALVLNRRRGLGYQVRFVLCPGAAAAKLRPEPTKDAS